MMEEFMASLGDFLSSVLGGGMSGILIAISLISMVLSVSFLILELSGRTISRKGIVPNNMRWDSTAIAITAIVAAIYIAGGMLQIAPIVPGFATWAPVRALPPIFATLFGLPGVLGVTFAMPLSDAIAGKLTLGSIAGMLSHFIAVTYLPYKLVGSPSLRTRRSWIQFYIWGVLIAGLWHATIIPGWLDFLNLLPAGVAWGVVTPATWLNHIVGTAILAPIILITVFPRIKAMGLYWRDRIVERRIPKPQEKTELV